MSAVRSFHVETTEQRDRLCSFLSKRETPFQVDYGPIREQRTLSQNSRLWKLHALASNITGDAVEDLHEDALCRHYGYTERPMPSGFIKRVPLKRSSTLEKKEFAAFMEATEAFYASELGVWLGQDE